MRPMRDIALGMQEVGLEAFAASVSASWMGQWKDLGLFDENEESWQKAFEQALERTLVSGGRFHFNLTGLDIAVALAGDPNWWVDRYTAWELQQIVRNEAWFRNTTFYLDGATLTSEDAAKLGVVMHLPRN